MKKLILFFLFIPGAMICQNKIEAPVIKNENATAGSLVDSKNYQLNNATSQVEQVDGIYIFAYSKPVKKYRVIGTVKPNALGSKDYQYIASILVEKIKKRYPTAQALIIISTEFRVEDCEVIEFID